MASQPHFNDHYKGLLNQLPPSIKKEVWLRLTTRKYNPLTEEQAGRIHPDIDSLLTKEVNRYYKKKDRQRLKVDANTTPDGSNALSRLAEFEKQLDERERFLLQQENNIKNTIESKVKDECKRTKEQYDNLSQQLRAEHEEVYNKLQFSSEMLKIKLEHQYNDRVSELEKKNKSHSSSLEVSLRKKDKEIEKLTSAITKAKNKYRDLEDVILAKDLKIIDLDDKLHKTSTRYLFDETIEPIFYKSSNLSEAWTSKREKAKIYPDIRKNYTFRTRV
ncbi:unnamed protein product [Rhizophagus irregularis]|uniref:Uncharacterized protein n=1 Tax=Rhizophagus irregularis TaxID=588596 RepID=A0A915YZD8_9GLOM|nr:unnamed protein product [Rhizophagus irregularis]